VTRSAFLLLALLLAACARAPALVPGPAAPAPTPLDIHIPPFARDPYEPFSRAAAVAIALREWRLFRQPVVYKNMPYPGPQLPVDEEREEGLWQRVGEYWWLALDRNWVSQRWTGKHDEHGHVFPAEDDGNFAWSAAFISYVMRIAGATDHFPYSERHSDYINAAARHDPDIALSAERPQDYAPLPGDLICMWRGKHPVGYADLPTPGNFPAHCDIVVASRPAQLDVIGGNVDDAVAMKHVPVAADGKLAGPDGAIVDPDWPWFVVLRARYDDDAVPVSAISRPRPPSIMASASQGSRASAAR
jgi:hypothetical protein